MGSAIERICCDPLQSAISRLLCLPREAGKGVTDTQARWGATLTFVNLVLILWALTAFIIPCFRSQLNELKFLGFPFGYYWSGQASLCIFVGLLFWYSHGQARIDEYFGFGAANEDLISERSIRESENAGFLSQLNLVYGVYAGGFVLFCCFLGVLEAAGVGDRVIGYFFCVFTILVYAGIGIISRTTNEKKYYVAGHEVPPLYNGMATAADWMSGASFMGLAGKVFVSGYINLMFVMGWTGGYILVSTLVAPYLRKFKCWTVPEFLAWRYRQKLKIGTFEINVGEITRMCGVIVLLACSFTYIVAQVYSTGIVMQRFLGLELEYGVFIGLAGILFCSMLGGMQAVTWTQVAQYIVLIAAFLIPLLIMSLQYNGAFFPQLDYGILLGEITKKENELVTQGLMKPDAPRYMDGPKRQFDYFALSFCLMCGTTSLPHVLMRYFTTTSVKAARQSVSWSLFFIFLLYVSTPAYAAYAKDRILTDVIGEKIAQLDDWIWNWSDVGLIKICGEKAANNIAAVENCNKDYGIVDPNRVLKNSDFFINSDAVVIAAPEMSNQPYVFAGLVASGGLAAALSTADGLLLAISNSLSHDIYANYVDPYVAQCGFLCCCAEPAKRLFKSIGFDTSTSDGLKNTRKFVVARFLLIAVAVCSAIVASTKPGDILSMVAWAFSLACGGQFPALVLGIWWKGTTPLAACMGMVSGFTLTLCYLIGTRYYDWELWWDVSNISSAIFGLPLGFVVTILMSFITPQSDDEVKKALDSLREPEVLLEDEDLMGKNKTDADQIADQIELGSNEQDTFKGSSEVGGGTDEFDEPRAGQPRM